VEISWKYLAGTPIGKHWADRFINFDYIEKQCRKKQLGLPDPGLGAFRFSTEHSTDIRNLFGTSKKVQKTDGSPVFVRVVFLSQSDTSGDPIKKVFPKGVPNTKWEKIEARQKGPGCRTNPKKLSGTEFCPFKGVCPSACISEAGNMAYQANVQARYAKSWFWLTEPILYLRVILSEIRVYSQTALISGDEFYARLNGTSDIPWERYIFMDEFKESIQAGFGGFYDYTKWGYQPRVGSFKRTMGYDFPESYHLTFSFDEKKSSAAEGKKWLKKGFSMSIILRKEIAQSLLATWQPHFPFLVDGDATDFRFADPPAALVILKRKGKLKARSEGITHLRTESEALDWIQWINECAYSEGKQGRGWSA